MVREDTNQGGAKPLDIVTNKKVKRLKTANLNFIS